MNTARSIWNSNLFCTPKIQAFFRGRQGWLVKGRKGLQLTADAVAAKMGISRGAYSQLEKSEERGTITLENLTRAADAMDCELVYAIRPKRRETFAEVIWVPLEKTAILHPWLNNCVPHARGEALGGVVRDLIRNPEFRRKQGWSQR
jgi:transcriptional regulator with XRE-family HTH domain